MNFEKIKKILFSTKNYNKIISAFNTLSVRDKQILLSDDSVKTRIYKIANAHLLIAILIDLPYAFRVDFLRTFDKDKLPEEEKILIDFLYLSNYDNFDHSKLSNLEGLKDKQVLNLIFRKLSKEKLREIISANYHQFITEYAFFEYSKKSDVLKFEPELINNIDDNNLFSEIKKRKTRFQTNNLDVQTFISIDKDKQNKIISKIGSKELNQNIINSYLEKYKNCSMDELAEQFKKLLSDFSYMTLLEMQAIIFLLDGSYALDLMQLFFKKVLNFENNVEDKYLISFIYYFKQLSNKTDELYLICKSKKFTIINYLNTGIIDSDIDKIFENVITVDQYQKINIKKVNKLTNLITKLFRKSENFSNKTTITLAYKLYLILGYENALDLLNFKFGFVDYDTLVNLLSKCNVLQVQIFNSEPIVDEYFINFLIGDKKDNNTTIKRMLRGELDIVKKEFSNIYNNFKRFQNTIGNKVHLNQLIPLLEENHFLLLPDEYKLTKDIINNIIKSYKYSDVLPNQNNLTDNELECIVEACDFYHLYLEKRLTSSIPRVYGKTKDNYSYEVIKLDDPIIMTLGYQTGCCFRLNGESKEFLRYCSENPHARVILIRNDNSEICAMIPIIRNGNVINGNSIERNSKGETAKIYLAFKSAYNDILAMSAYYEENPIIAGLVTNLHSNCLSKKPIKGNIYPIRDNYFYTNYEKATYIVAGDEDITEKNFKFYTPEAIYYDERPNVLVYHWNMTDKNLRQEIDNRLKSILHKLNKNTDRVLSFAKYIVCSEDWFLKLDWDGITGECLDKDPRAKEEFNAVKSHLEREFEKKDYYQVDFNDTALKSEGITSLIQKKLSYENIDAKKEG